MTAPGRRGVSYLPGRWAALVTDELSLLCDVPLTDPVLAQCWDAAGGPDPAEALLQILMPPGRPQPPSLVLVASAGATLRLVVAGGAHAEVFAGQQDPEVRSAPNPQSWVDEQLDASLDVRLVAADQPPFARMSPLPLTSGIVLASFVFSTAVLSPAGEDAAGWIPPPLAQPSSEFPVPPDLDAGFPAEPAPQLSGVFRALPWRASFAEPGTADATGPDGPNASPAGPPAEVAEANAPVPDAAPEPPAPPPPPPFDAPQYPPPPAYEPPMFGGDPWGPRPWEVAGGSGGGVGVLRLANGDVVPLDQDVLLGRAPFAADPTGVRLVEVPSAENDISRSHVRITVGGGQVCAVDLGSTNGTAVTLPGRPATLLRPHEPFVLEPGAVLSLADEAEVRYESG